MNYYYVMQDTANRDNDGKSFKMRATTLSRFAPYIRETVMKEADTAEDRELCKKAAHALEQEKMLEAEMILKEFFVYFSVEECK